MDGQSLADVDLARGRGDTPQAAPGQVKIVDLNLLLYAVNASAPGHERAFNWWNQALNKEEQIGLAWSVVLGFLRLTTRPGLFISKPSRSIRG
jgi:predicted nucleic acid-binding protein